MTSRKGKNGGPAAPCLNGQVLMRLGVEALVRLVEEECALSPAFAERVRERIARIGAGEAGGTGQPGGDEPIMVGNSPAMHRVFEAIRKVAVTDAPVLITGESGTGKELAALAIHERSSFAEGPFVAVNCAAIPATLIASELFGHEKGAFTGAHQRKIGRVEAAQGGTLFLDEIGDLPTDLQAHLLRFLQEKTITRLGGHRSIKIEARIIAATNQDLKQAMASGRFRDDLFYRLNVLHVEMPPLRDRGEDLDLISTFFLRRFSQEMDRPIAGFAPGTLEAIRAHDWPGNVRELISTIRRAVVMAEGRTITAADVGLEPVKAAAAAASARRKRPGVANGAARGAPAHGNGAGGARPGELDPARIEDALARCADNVSRAARELGVSRVTLYRYMRKHNIRLAANGRG